MHQLFTLFLRFAHNLKNEYTHLYKSSSFSLVIPGILLGLYVINRRKKALANISFEFGIPTTLKRSNLDFTAILPINFDNASPQQASIENLYLQITYNKKIVGNVFFAPKIIIAPANRTKVPANVRLSSGNLLLAFGSQFLSGDFELDNLQVVGFVKGDGVNLYIDKPIKLSFNQSA